MYWFNIILFVGAVPLCVLTTRKCLCESGPFSDGPRFRRLAPALILLLALGLRLYLFGAVPGGMNQDGAMAAVDAKALADYGTDRFGMRFPVHLTAWGYGQMSALLSYMMAPFIRLFGLSAVTARLPLLIMSMAGLVFLFLLCRDVFGGGAATAVLAIAAVAPWHFMQSRWALDCNLYPHFFVMGLYLLNRGLRDRKCLYFSMPVFGLCMYCYGVALYTLPLFLLAAGIYLLRTKRLGLPQILLSALLYLAVAWPFLAVMAVNYFRLPTIQTPLFTIPFFPDSMRSGDILFFSADMGVQLRENLRSLMDVAALQRKDLPWNDIAGFGSLYLFSAPFTMTGLIFAYRAAREKSGAALIYLFLLTGIWTGLATNSVNVNRVNIIFYPLIIFTGLGVWLCVKKLRPAGALASMAYLTAFALFCFTYFTSYRAQIEQYFLKDFGEAVSAVKDDGAERVYITPNSQSRDSAAVSEILTLFYHETDAEYFQGKYPQNGLYYDDRYSYVGLDRLSIDPEEDAVYVVSEDELPLFDPQSFSFEHYGRYCVARPITTER